MCQTLQSSVLQLLQEAPKGHYCEIPQPFASYSRGRIAVLTPDSGVLLVYPKRTKLNECRLDTCLTKSNGTLTHPIKIDLNKKWLPKQKTI